MKKGEKMDIEKIITTLKKLQITDIRFDADLHPPHRYIIRKRYR